MDAPNPTCPRCSKPIRPGTYALRDGHVVHIRCAARDTWLESQEAAARREQERAEVVRKLARELIAEARPWQSACLACGLPLWTGGSVVVQGDHVVHSACWRDEEHAAG